MNYMTLESAIAYLLQIGVEFKIDLKDTENIDGTVYIFTTAVKSAIGAEAFRLMECKVTTYHITYNDKVLMELKRKAAEQMKPWKQYDGHEKDYVLGKALVDCRSNMRLVFYQGENLLIEPRENIREFKDLYGKNRRMILVWSMNNQCATSVDVDDIEWTDLNLPF